jgi:ribA/ribD-fused uncharacterized protein
MSNDIGDLMGGDVFGLKSLLDSIPDDELEEQESSLTEEVADTTQVIQGEIDSGSSLEDQAKVCAQEVEKIRSKLIITNSSENDETKTVTEEVEDKKEDVREVIDTFSGKYDFLSNFFPSSQKSSLAWEEEDDCGETDIKMNFEEVPTLEHAYQASKTLDRDVQVQIRDAATAKQAKRLGRRAPLTNNWEDKKIDVMERLLEDKFGQNFELKIRLLETGDAELIEGNTWKDDYWGVTKDGVGENHLGKLLMKVRNRIRRDEGDVLGVVKSRLDREGLGFVSDWIDESKISFK